MTVVDETVSGQVDRCVECNSTYGMVEIDGSFYCGYHHETCARCETDFVLGNGFRDYYQSRINQMLCNGCFCDQLSRCYRCDQMVENEDTTTVDDDTWCDTCAEHYALWCESCDAWHRVEENCPEYEEPDDDGNYHSRRERRDIHDYSYKPEPLFRMFVDEDKTEVTLSDYDVAMRSRQKIRDIFMGFELETEAMDASLGDGIEAMRPWTNSHFAYLKYDGSLNNGFEIVSHPATLDWYQALDMDPLKKLRKLGFRSWNVRNHDVGIHIHVSRTAFVGDAHLHRLCQLILKNRDDAVKFAGRDCHYAPFDGNLAVVRSTLVKKQGSYERMAVNLSNSNTVEIRMFRGSLNSDRLLADLELVDSAVTYTKDMTFREARDGGLKWKSYRRFVKEKRERYPHLATIFNGRVTPE